MYLLSQLWLYLLLACLAGFVLGLLVCRAGARRRHAAELQALQDQYREERQRADAVLVRLRGEHVQALDAANAEYMALQTRFDALDIEHRQTLLRALTLSASVDEQQMARLGLNEDVESLQARLGALQVAYESRIALLNTETGHAAQLTDQLADLQTRHAALEAEQQQAQARIVELALLVPPPPAQTLQTVTVVVRPAPSAAATMTCAELEPLVLAAGDGRQPAPVSIDHQPPDDLTVIDGIGPVNAQWLHEQGVHYFWQIASWSPDELAWMAHHLPNFGSRVYRENWIAQAAQLATRPPMG